MKLIVADLDGTLIHKKWMSNETIHTIKKLQEEGYMFTIATGRHMQATKSFVKELNIIYPVICTNGGVIYDFQHNVVIHQEVIPSTVVYHVLNLLNHYALNYLIYTTKDIVSFQNAKDKLEERIGLIESKVITEQDIHKHVEMGVLKILIIDERDSMINHIKQQLSQIPQLNMVQSQASFLDIGSNLASKGRALRMLAKHLNVALEDIIAIGDQENDISMIEVAGIGVAMGQGDEILKSKADYITKSFEEEGFTFAINEIVYSNHTK